MVSAVAILPSAALNASQCHSGAQSLWAPLRPRRQPLSAQKYFRGRASCTRVTTLLPVGFLARAGHFPVPPSVLWGQKPSSVLEAQGDQHPGQGPAPTPRRGSVQGAARTLGGWESGKGQVPISH